MHPRFNVARYVARITGIKQQQVSAKMKSEKGLIELILAIEKNGEVSMGRSRGFAEQGGPRSVVARELMGRILKGKVDFGKSVKVDLVVWRKRRHKYPFLTRLGGSPWREKSLPWPKTKSGQDYTFVGQYCLSEMASPLPFKPKGELILIFSSHENVGPDTVHLEWANTTLKRPVEQKDCPPPQFPVPLLFAELRRAKVYPDFYEMEPVYRVIPKPLEGVLGYAPMPESTLIGTHAWWHQSALYEDQTQLCTFSSFNPGANEWPFPDQQAPLPKQGDRLTLDGDRIAPSFCWTMYILSRDGKELFARSEQS